MSLIQGLIRKIVFSQFDTDRFKGAVVEEPTSKELRYKALQKIFSMLVTDTDYESMTQKVVDVMVEEMDFIGGVLFLPDRDNKRLRAWSYTQSELGKKVVGWLPKPFREHVYPLDQVDNLTVQTYLTKKVFIDSSMRKFISPVVNGEMADMMQKFMGMNLCITLPVVFRDRTLGIVFFTSARKDSSQEEQEMLRTFSDQVAIAIENAELFSNLQRQFLLEAERSRNLLALHEISKVILETTQVDGLIQQVLDKITNQLGYTIALLALIDYERDFVFIEGVSQQSQFKNALSYFGKNPFGIGFSLSTTDNNITKTARDGVPRVGENIEEFFCPPFDLKQAKLFQDTFKSKIIASFPIKYASQKIRGVIVLGLDKIIDKFIYQDKDTMSTLANDIGIALERADILDRLRKVNFQLINANEHLKELDRLKDDFVSVASHELRTPMTAIKSYLWMALAQKGGPLNEKQKYYLQRSYNSVDRLIKLVNDMLNISRIESGRLTVEMQQVRVEDLIREVIDEVGPRASELGIAVVLDIKDVVPTVLADPDKIKGVLYNLIGNSLKFTQKGGKITIACTQRGGMVDVVVRDTGMGISSENLPKLFQKFGILPGTYVTNQSTLGTGLGLYICRLLIELHEGKIWVESEGAGKGAIFAFSLKIFNENDLNRLKAKYSNQLEARVGLIHTQIL